jgi:hypothetical protein
MLLGNDRMISRWPARGGPVVADEVVYFAAGIWPSEGVYVVALDRSSGERASPRDSAWTSLAATDDWPSHLPDAPNFRSMGWRRTSLKSRPRGGCWIARAFTARV